MRAFRNHFTLKFALTLIIVGVSRTANGNQANIKNHTLEEKLCTTRKANPGKCLPFSTCFPFIYRSSETRSVYENDFGIANSGLAEEILNSTRDTSCSSLFRTPEENEQMVCCAIEREGHFGYLAKPVIGFNTDNVMSGQCGQVKIRHHERSLGSTKITGGKQAQRGEFPWMVAIFGPNGKHTCGGTLLNEEFVLTAAHCLSTYNQNDVAKLTVTIGDHNIQSTKDGLHEHRKIRKVFIHAGFKISTHTNDIALMKLEKPVSFSNYIQPICLPNKNTEMIEGLKTVVSGWGRDRSHGYPADILRKVEIPVWRLAECKRVFGIFAPGRVADSNICAGDGKKSKDACLGDSGGPLSFFHGSSWYQVGIVSWGKGCGSFPGVYSRVDSFLPWILKNMQS